MPLAFGSFRALNIRYFNDQSSLRPLFRDLPEPAVKPIFARYGAVLNSTVVFIAALALALTTAAAFLLDDKSKDLAVTMLGTFWGFLLTQAGMFFYERWKERQELVSLLSAVRNELVMNRNTIAWIDYLLRCNLAGRHVHGHGFAGVDAISTRAIENLLTSPLLHKYGSRDFSSQQILSIYQTIHAFQREIPTDNVDGRNKERYDGIRFPRIVQSFDLLLSWIDDEGARLYGSEGWNAVKERCCTYADPYQSRRNIEKEAMRLFGRHGEIRRAESVVQCNGGHDGLGHPLVYLAPGGDGLADCPYCGRSYVLAREPRLEAWPAPERRA